MNHVGTSTAPANPTMGEGAAFRDGLLFGVFVALVSAVTAAYLLHDTAWLTLTREPAPAVLGWLERNLGSSVPVFAALSLLFAATLVRLRRVLAAQPQDIDAIAQADHLSDLWTSLYFGAGVIWTAIGMRGALLFALGDPDEITSAGAFAVLQRMVDGGILLALSSTIVGGVGGYLLRTAKTLLFGHALKRAYAGQARRSAEHVQTTLGNIERKLRAAPSPSEPSPASAPARHALAAMREE
ncbi:MAG: hypothetical protein AAF184_11150 [Pseudomonadota bacterium]